MMSNFLFFYELQRSSSRAHESINSYRQSAHRASSASVSGIAPHRATAIEVLALGALFAFAPLLYAKTRLDALTARVSSSSRSKSASAPGVSLPFVARLRSFAGCALPQSKAAAGSAAPVHLHSRLAHPGMEPSSGTASSALSEV